MYEKGPCARRRAKRDRFSLVEPNVTGVKTPGYVCMYVCIIITYSKSKDQPDKVANPGRGQLNRENEYSLVPVRA